MKAKVTPKMKTSIAAVVIIASLVIAMMPATGAQESVDLGTTDPFAILAGSTITNDGPSVINGDIGLHPGSSVTGFEEATVNGEFHIGDEVAETAKEDLTTAYNDAAGRPVNETITTELGGEVLLPGVYDSESGTFSLMGTLTLDAQGDPDAVWIFQMESTLITAVDSSVVLINEAQACNVFWQVGSSATIETGTDFKGNILAQASISMKEGATLEGRALALDGAVTLINNEISIAECAEPPGEEPPGEEPPGEEPPGEEPPGEEPPGEEPPGEEPPGEEPPGEEPPGEEPPGEEPPGEEPPGEEPPAEAPPAEAPPGEDVSGEEPPLTCSTELIANANPDSSITLMWKPIEGAEENRIHRAEGDGAFELHAEIDGDATAFTDTDTVVGDIYRYEVRPVVAGVESDDCDVVEVTAIPVFPSLIAAAAAAALGTGAYVFSRRRT